MSAALQAARLDRMRMERDDIARLDARIAHAQRTRADAQAALTAAQQALEEIDAELGGLSAQRSLAAERLHNVARVRLRDVMATIPHDVLQCIFDARVCSEKPDTTTTSRTLMCIPFEVSRVCKRWREAALAMPSLWSHLYVCKPRLHTLQLAGLVLERSKGAPLNMYLTHGRGDQHFGKLLKILAGHISRWRSLVIIFKGEADWSLLKHPMPVLEKLVVSHAGDQDREPTDILPFAPRLTTFCIHDMASFSLQKETALPSLNELVWNPHDAIMETAWVILRRAAATLTRVVLAPQQAHISPMATTAAVATPMLHLPRIHELTLANRFPNMTEALASFAVPGLTTLVLMQNVIVPNIVQFLDSVSGTVTCIDLFLHLGADESAILRILRNVTEVGFGCATNFKLGADYRVNDAFFSQLCESDALGAYSWPKLTTLVFDQCGEFDASDGPGGADLLRFIRSRTAPNLNDESTPRRLQRVVLGAKGVPTWLSAEVNRIMCTE